MAPARTALVVDPDDRFREALRSLLPSLGLEAVERATAAEALAALDDELPALLIAEVDLPDTGGFELCRRVRARHGEQVAIVLTSTERTGPGDRTVGLILGADDVVAKPVDWQELLARLRRLLARAGVAHDGRAGLAPAADDGGLTPRERQVLQLLAEGHGQDEICAALVIAPKTVSAHIQRILGKIGAHSRAQAVAIAYRDGLVRPPR